jgi:molybdopterin synthase sulfur carrier subunit
MAIVTMRYWAAAKDAAGVAEQVVTADTLAGALRAIGGDQPSALAGPGQTPAAGGSRLTAVLARSSFLVNGHPVGTRAAESVELTDGAVVEVLPPFAGG